jgi:plastocyanin
MTGSSHRRWTAWVLAGCVTAGLAACASSSPGRVATAATTTAAAQTTAPAATVAPPSTEPADVQHLHFRYGPLDIQPGQNLIALSRNLVPKPAVDGWILRMAPNLQKDDGTVPPVDVIHLHHGVWLNLSRPDSTAPGLPERFFAAGEEKTALELPSGFGYPFKASDTWLLNYMIHDLTPHPYKIWITYDLDFLPATSPHAASLRAARPVWLDVQNGSSYPVFDVLRGSGQNGKFTYPDDAANPYGGQPAKNVWTVDRNSVLVGTAGHLHPGGLYDDLNVVRQGAGTAHLFRSDAHYWEPAGAVSWDVAMTATPHTWRVAVHPGDVLRVSATYDSSRASWYESMGIMVVWMADGTDGPDPFTTKVDAAGYLTHGHLPENGNHGGRPSELLDPSARPAGTPLAAVNIRQFNYGAGDLTTTGGVPVVKAGHTLTFTNLDANIGVGIWHSITACKAPCDQTTGVAFPLADGDIQFDSGQLGTAGPPTADRLTWTTPATLPAGLYTYFCRIHPFMRGAFRVVTS